MDRTRPLCVHLLPDTREAGAENRARYLLEGLERRGELDLELVYFGAGEAHEAFAELGIPLRQLDRRRALSRDLPFRARRLRKLYAAHPPAIFHTWLLEGNVVGLLAARGWQSTSVVITQCGAENELDYPLHIRVQRALRRRADQAISNSEEGARVLRQLGFSPELLSVVPNGIPAARAATGRDRRDVRRELEIDVDAPVVAWVGRADDARTLGHKDMPTLFAAAERLARERPRALVVLIGPTAAELERLGMRLPANVRAIGWRPRPADYIAAANVVAISSRAEGNSNVAGEALMLGVPVATTATGGHQDAVAEAGGRTVPPGDPQALAAAITSLLDHPPSAADVREVAERRLSIDRMVDETMAIYERLLDRRAASTVVERPA